jgi:hypothetical protein
MDAHGNLKLLAMNETQTALLLAAHARGRNGGETSPVVVDSLQRDPVGDVVVQPGPTLVGIDGDVDNVDELLDGLRSVDQRATRRELREILTGPPRGEMARLCYEQSLDLELDGDLDPEMPDEDCTEDDW